MIKKILTKLLNNMNKNRIRINIHGFNYAGENTTTMHSIVDELFSESTHYRKGEDSFKGYLEFKHSYVWPSLIKEEFNLIDKLNNLDKEKNEDLFNLLKSNEDKELVLSINDLGRESMHGNIMILKFDGTKWYHDNYRKEEEGN